MAQLVVGAVGAVIGFAVGGPTGAYYGWAIGTTIGGIAFAPKLPGIEGPRLDDLKAQKSNYGIPIPIIYGAMRAAGNVIWATDLVETSTTTGGGGGKGGGGGGGEQTTYSYSQSFAVGLCEGTIIGVRRIWANGKLIYNLSDTADNATIIASNNAASGIRFYTGSETQTADSLIQAHVGAANTPAFRGLAYVVFESMQLADYGNRAPNLEFEVVRNGNISSPVVVMDSNTYPESLSYGPTTLLDGNYFYRITISNNIEVFDVSDKYNITKISGSPCTGVPVDMFKHNEYIIVINTSYSNCLEVFDVSDKYNITKIISTYAGFSYANNGFSDSDYVYMAAQGYLSLFTVNNGVSTVISNIPNVANSLINFIIHKDDIDRRFMYSVCGYIDSSTPYGFIVRNISNSSNEYITYNYPVYMNYGLFVGSAAYKSPIHITSNYLFFTDPENGIIRIFDISNAEFPELITSLSLGFTPHDVRISNDKLFITDYNNSNRIYFYDISNKFNPELLFYFGTETNSDRFINVTDDGRYIISSEGYGVTTYFYTGEIITSNSPTLSSIITDICSRVGLTAGDVNVSELTDLVPGYMVQRGTARSWLEQLMQAYYFDAVESDGKIKFVKRGGASVVSIPEDDLAAHEYGSSPPDTLVTTRKQEMELPVEVAVQYMDKDAAYAVGSQLSQRLTTDSDNKIGINLAIAMDASKAKQISDVLMYDAWTSRTSFDAQQAWKYSYLEPTDVVTISKGGRTYTARITSEDASGGIYNRSLVLEDSSIYTQSASAPSMPTPTDTVSLTPLTKLLLLDIPLLRDQDDGYGFYAAACGYGDGWHGTQGFKSNDAGATWSSFGDPIINEASIGSTSTALGNFTGGNIFDETNYVTVVLTRGFLSSDTEINILNGSNVALIGNEIVQFKTATLTATDTYLLSGLLRGRRGTEWAMTTHAIGDRFVLLSSTTTYLFYGPSSEYDVLRKYKGVSFGNYLANATSQDFTNTAVSLIPYAPVLLGGGRNAALDVILNWTRRTRIAGGWNNYSDVPIGETTEAYEVEIYDATYTTLKRTITGITTNTTTYTAAQQVIDYGATQPVVYFVVYQISAIVGRGYGSRGIA